MGPAQLLVLALPAGLIVAAYRCWDMLLASFTTQQLIVWGLWLLVCGTYWGFGGLFHLVDRSGRPEALSRAKLQPQRAPDRARVTTTQLCANLLAGQVFILLPYSFLQHRVHTSSSIPLALRVEAALPEVPEVLAHLAALVLLEEFFFYYTHRLLHQPWLYRNVSPPPPLSAVACHPPDPSRPQVHRQHHAFTAPVALAAVYAHPAEVATSNALPLVLTPLLLHCHLFTVVVWCKCSHFLCASSFSKPQRRGCTDVLAVVGSQLHHCGYSCGLSAPPQSGLLRFVVPVPQPEFHDWHHERGGGPNGVGVGGNFGLLGVLDALHGTDRRWRQSLAKADL